ncbi:hypothetical protein F4703DRAFT_1881273 [Phycomyces blakesleeanus]
MFNLSCATFFEICEVAAVCVPSWLLVKPSDNIYNIQYLLPTNLPFEILSQIAHFVSADYKFSCILTCKAWRYPFQESLLENIEVSSMDTLDNICAIVKDSTGNYTPQELITQSLRVTGKTSLADWQETRVFKTFPNLKYLDMGSLSFYDVDIKCTKYGPPWESVTSLKFQVSPTSWRISNEFILEILRKIPNLQSIDISSDSFYYLIEFDLSQYNSFHIALPKLTSIKARLGLKDIHPNAVPSIPRTLPALYVTNLYLEHTYCSYLWLYYFCYKYPNLRTLIWKSVHKFGNIVIEEDDGRKISLLRSVKRLFPHLETVDFYTEEPTEWSHSIFWNLLCLSDVPIKKLKYKIKSRDSDATCFGMTIERFTRSFSTTLEKISIVGNVYFDVENIVKLECIYCPNLVSVEINECGVSIALDNLLDNWPALRRLKFSNVHLYINPESQRESAQHGLRFMVLDNIVASAPVFKYMSFRCRLLQYMSLSQSQICGPILDETGSLCIDMSYTNFRLLQLDHVKFYSSEEDISKDTSINLTLLSHSAGNQTLDEAKKKVNANANENRKSTVEHLSWYHLYCELDCPFDYVPKVRQLSQQEVCTAIKYFEDFQLKDRTNIFEVERSCNGQVDKEDWKEDLYRGYVEFRCGHITEYAVPLFWVSETSFWQNLFDSSW